MSASGCCGRIEGDLLDGSGGLGFAERRKTMESLGPLYQALKDRYGAEVEVSVIDPRNQVILLPKLLGDARRHGVGLRDTFRTLLRLTTTAVVIDGRLFSRGEWPKPERVCRYLDDRMAGVKASHATL